MLFPLTVWPCGRQTGNRQARPDICCFRADKSSALSPAEMLVPCRWKGCYVSTARPLRWVFFSALPFTKQSSLCKILGPWRDQANSLQGLLKPPVINVLLSCGLFLLWTRVTDGRRRGVGGISPRLKMCGARLGYDALLGSVKYLLCRRGLTPPER